MRATGIVRRIDELGRVVIPKEIRRTLRIREGDPSYTTFILSLRRALAISALSKRLKSQQLHYIVNNEGAVAP